ncbi:hypothetical protein ACLBOM_08755 [Escherichia coli]
MGWWADAGGFGDLTLQFTTYAVRLARGYMFPPGATPEEQAAQSGVWNAVVFWAGTVLSPATSCTPGGGTGQRKVMAAGNVFTGPGIPLSLQTATSAGHRGSATGSGDGRAVVAGGGVQAGWPLYRGHYRIWRVQSGISIRRWHSFVQSENGGRRGGESCSSHCR